MAAKVAALWVLGLVTLVPWCLWRLFTTAGRDEAALLIVLPLFWVFGFWGLAGPLLLALQMHRLLRAIRSARSADEVRALFADPANRETAVGWVAQENGLPRWVVRLLWSRLQRRLGSAPRA